MRLPASERTGPENTHAFVSELLGEDVHATRVMSLANGVVGVLHAAALGIHAIGRGLADALDLDPKHAVKQVDRLLSNSRLCCACIPGIFRFSWGRGLATGEHAA